MSLPEEYNIKKILLIDDDADELLILQAALLEVDPSLRVSYLNNLSAKVERLLLDPPDIVFLDINMPKEDGFTWLKKLRNAGYTFPIVIYSTTRNPEKIAVAYQLGANLFLTKPNDFMESIKTFKSVLQLKWHDYAIFNAMR